MMITDIHTTATTSTVMTMTMGTHTTMITLTDIHTMIAMIIVQIQTYPDLHLMEMIGPLMDTLTAITHTRQIGTIMTMDIRTIMIT